MGRTVRGNYPTTEVTKKLDSMIEDFEGLIDAAETVMKEVEQVAKEVGGKAERSTRYQMAEAIKTHVRDLQRIYSGHYTYTLPSYKPETIDHM